MGLSEPGLDRLIHAGYKLLDLITYFTAGVQEVRAWTIRRGTKAPGAAGVIHRTSKKASSRPIPTTAKTYSLWKRASRQGKGPAALRSKEYVVRDGDISFLQVQRLKN